MEAQLRNVQSYLQLDPGVAEQGQSIGFLPYQDMVVQVLSDFSNNILTYATMLEIAKAEVELLLIAKAKNPGKINVERSLPRNVRLAILNRLRSVMR